MDNVQMDTPNPMNPQIFDINNKKPSRLSSIRSRFRSKKSKFLLLFLIIFLLIIPAGYLLLRPVDFESCIFIERYYTAIDTYELVCETRFNGEYEAFVKEYSDEELMKIVQETTLDWEEYENKLLGFSFKYPPIWRLEGKDVDYDESVSFRTLYTLPIDSSEEFRVKLIKFDDNISSPNGTKVEFDEGLFEKTDNLTIGGLQAAKFTAVNPTYNQYTDETYTINIIRVNNTDYSGLNIYMPFNSVLDDYVYNKVLNTFEFTDNSKSEIILPKINNLGIFNWKTHKSNDYNISFRYPSYGKLSETPSEEFPRGYPIRITLTPDETSSSSAYFTVSISEKVDYDKTIEEVSNDYLFDTLSSLAYGYTYADFYDPKSIFFRFTKSEYEVGGMKTEMLIIEKGENKSNYEILVPAISNDKVYIFSYSHNEELDQQEMLAIMDKILSTLRFTN